VAFFGLHLASQQVTLVLMAINSGDLRNRFRRTDYGSEPLGPRQKFVAQPKPTERPIPVAPVNPPAPTPIPQNQPVAVNRPNIEERPVSVPVKPAVQVPQPQPTTAPAKPVKPPKVKRRDRRRAKRDNQPKAEKSTAKIVFTTVLVMLFIAGAGYAAWHYSSKKPVVKQSVVPAQYTSSSLGYQLYFPTNLPDGYRVAPKSFGMQDGAFIFTVQTPDGKSVPASEQVIPDDKTADDFVPAPKQVPVTDVEKVDVAGGKSATAKWKDSKGATSTISSTVFDKTWIILNISSASKQDAVAIINAFEKL